MRALTWRARAAIYRRGQALPTYGERTWTVSLKSKLLLARWFAREGLRYVAIRDIRGQTDTWRTLPLSECYTMGIKKREVTAMDLAPPAAPATTSYLVLSPMLLEFTSATTYEGGLLRTPGYFTIRTRWTEWECTLYDPDAGMRLPVRAPTVDDLMVAVEVALGTQEAPWEVDRYLSEQLAKKVKKQPLAAKKKSG